MDTIGSSPFCWLEFDANGGLVDSSALVPIKAMLSQPTNQDFVIMSHGWKNTKSDAKTLYQTLWQNTCAALTGRDPTKIAVAGIVWPAKAYATDIDDAAAAASAAGQALSAGDSIETRDLTDAEFAAALADFRDVFGGKGDTTILAARQAAMDINSESANSLFTSAMAAAGIDGIAHNDTELRKDAARIASLDNPDVVLSGLAEPPSIPAAPGFGGTSDLGTTIGALLHGPRAAVARFLNQLTYFEMKKRAGIVGVALGSSVLPNLNPPHRIRLHLIGHSFGARLATAAASALPNPLAFDFFSLTLLQGAFSHNALAPVVEPGIPGAFANVIGRATGPISITHTHNDRACTFWYALASRLSQDTTQGFGDKDDAFGAMGANGAQKLPASAIVPDMPGQSFAPQRGKVNGFLADGYIVRTDMSDAHNNITNPACGKLVAAVLKS